MDHRALDPRIGPQPPSTSGMNGVISNGCVPSRDVHSGGTETVCSAKYFRTVRQSQSHSRPISANVAPALCKARKRRMFIRDSVTADHEQGYPSVFYLAVDNRRVIPHSGRKGLNTPRPTYTSDRTENDI